VFIILAESLKVRDHFVDLNRDGSKRIKYVSKNERICSRENSNQKTIDNYEIFLRDIR
jgi:hypothetical protein